MDIQNKKEALIAEIEQFKEEAMKMHFIEAWSGSYKTDPFSHAIDDENNIFWMKAQAHQLWQFWQAAKAQAVPEGFVLVPKELSDEVADELASDAFNNAKSLFDSEYRGYSALQREHIRLRWCKRSAKQYQSDYKTMIEAQEQSHD